MLLFYDDNDKKIIMRYISLFKSHVTYLTYLHLISI